MATVPTEADIVTPLATVLDGFGGFLRCETCGEVQPVGDTGHYLRNGWPRHCGYTMRWWTARLIAAGQVPEISA